MYSSAQTANIIDMYASGASIAYISLKYQKGASSIMALLCRAGVYKTQHKTTNNMQNICAYCKSKLFSSLIECVNCGAPC